VTNILTTTEGANALRTATNDVLMLDLLSQVDAYINNATGRDWTADSPIRPEAKAAARMLLVRWHEDPGGMAAGSALGFGLSAAVVQLEALALQLETTGVPEEALALAATNVSGEMAVSANLVLVFNHPMASGATTAVTLEDATGATVTSVNSLDTATSRILTINPTGSLTADSTYTIVINHAPDIYGQTLDTEIPFWTA
jgi:hypothetical protein